MKLRNNIALVDGILLTAPLFQQWNQYWESRYLLLARMISPFCWGISSLVIDESALLLRKFRILACDAIFPNGIMVSFDAKDHFELCFDLTKNQTQTIYLAFPLKNNIQGVAGYESSATEHGHRAYYKIVQDEFQAQKEQEIGFVLPNLLLLNEDNRDPHYVRLPVAEVNWADKHQFALSETFIPPLLNIKKNSIMSHFLERIKNLLSSTITLLLKDLEVEKNYPLLLQILSSLKHDLVILEQVEFFHPWCLYQKLSLLLSTIDSTNISEFAEKIIPIYDHTTLGRLFPKLEQQIIAQLDQLQSKKHIRFVLKNLTKSILITNEIPESLFDHYDFYLAVSKENQLNKNITLFFQQIKISSPSDIHTLINSALPSLKLTTEEVGQPKDFYSHLWEYFFITPLGQYWEHIKQEKKICVFVPNECSENEYEIIAVRKKQHV